MKRFLSHFETRFGTDLPTEELIMSLVLNQGTKPEGLEIKTWGLRGLPDIQLGDYEISMLDFLECALYVLTNTDLEPDDPRLNFIENVRRMKQVDGYMFGRKRLG